MSTNTIVVGVDETPAGTAALSWAAREAELRGADLKIVHVWQIDAAVAMAGAEVPWLAYETDARSNAARWVADTIGAEDAQGRPRRIDVVQGAPGPTLVDASRDAAMLVVGTRVHTGISRVLFGSVSHYCLTHAQCVVVAVPTTSTAETVDVESADELVEH
ncbi:universal stress protein [Aeromicrobium tamlense]|uniref:Nucleotide-binding universal stress UspA family protein n=1 Tax=Aeromicrobium tamlense TaxID=375541 RepID=A0A8I0KL67_9ACTN|nr:MULTISPECIES: universal stress protein [Aeromicrobium]MBD1269723.1 universal stress protein [Aeromicrobium tamlense]NYI39621.1 nucleotide-binding universal stress UspA family protein [Aeromicrobium tamlense]